MRNLGRIGALCLSVLLASAAAGGAAIRLPTGMQITPDAAPDSSFERLATGLRDDGTADAGAAAAMALSPDGRTLLVLTSGYNENFKTPSGEPIVHAPIDPMTGGPAEGVTGVPRAEWVFVYDVSTGGPQLVQRLAIPDSYVGLAWAPDSRGFYVSGGVEDRVFHFIAARPAATSPPPQPFIGAPSFVLGHDSRAGDPFPKEDGGLLARSPAAAKDPDLPTGAVVAGIALDPAGTTLYAADLENDALSIVDLATHRVRDLPFATAGSGEARGEFPFGVAVAPGSRGAPATVFVSSQRDAEVLATAPAPAALVAIQGCSGAGALALAPGGATLYAACANEDALAVIDVASRTLVAKIPLGRPGDPYRGANPNAVAVAPDGRRAYVTLGGENALAVVDLDARRVLGRIPTGWYPTGVALARGRLFVCNAKSVPGPDPSNGYAPKAGKARNTTFINQYGWALEKAGLLTLPVPSDAELARLSDLVDRNDGFADRQLAHGLDFLRGKIRHVIYITNENRTYDQVLGDLPEGNGDPALALFPQPLAPNHHAFASEFVDFDNFYVPGESSGVGWNWSVAGHTNDYVERSQAVLYGNAGFTGLTYDYQGIVRNLNLALPQTGGSSIFDERLTGVLDPSGSSSILPGPRDPAANDGDGDEMPDAVGGYLWDAALRRGLTVRNYGEHIDLGAYDEGSPGYVAPARMPFAAHALQAAPAKLALVGRTDPYYRGFDQSVPDQWRVDEWLREFAGYEAAGKLPDLEMMTVPHDHFGDFDKALEGLGTPQLQFADNDYALGRIVAAVSHSRFWKDTAIFIDEDDSQSGPDHVDTHRSTFFAISPYIKRGIVDHGRYTTENVLRTIEAILNLRPLGENDANAAPMTADFTATPDLRPYDPIVPGSLCAPPVARELLGGDCYAPGLRRTRAVAGLYGASWWATMTAGMDFSHPDALDAERFNAVLTAGTQGTLAALL